MAVSQRIAVFVGCYLIVINFVFTQEYHRVTDEELKPCINNLLKYLNSDPNTTYEYLNATLVNAQKESEDVTTLSLNMDVNCLSSNIKVCNSKILTCNGALLYNSVLNVCEVKSEIQCLPYGNVKFQNLDDTVNISVAERTSQELGKSFGSGELNSGLQLEPIENVQPDTLYCLGCANDLDTNVEGLSFLTDTALHHIESERTNIYSLIKVLRVQQQVVAGIKYILLLEVISTTCSKTMEFVNSESCPPIPDAVPEICQIIYLQKPWINKSKHIIANNCTISQEYMATDQQSKLSDNRNDQDNEININGDYRKPFMYPKFVDKGFSGSTQDVDPIRLAEIEAQILFGEPITPVVANISSLSNDKTFDGDYQNEGVINKYTQKGDDLMESFGTNIDTTETKPVTITTETLYSTSKKNNERLRRSVPGGIIDISDKELPKINKLLQHSLLHLDSQSQHVNKYKVLEIRSASKQVVAGLLYRIEAIVVLSNCSKNEVSNSCEQAVDAIPQVCNFKIWDRPWLPNGRETNITCNNDNKEYNVRSKRSITYHQASHLLGKDDHDIHLGMFKEFVQKYNKVYPNKQEFEYRFRVFRDNMKVARFFNKHEKGTAKYGPTKFADLTRREYVRYLGLNTNLVNDNSIPFPPAFIPNIDLPVEFDWRSKGVVSPVKNQGMCGSCWAFSVTGNIEGQYAIKYGKLLEFSEQELVDCDRVDDGCNGGLMDNAYRAIEEMGGLETEQDYPYDAEREKCHFNKTLARVQLSGALNISHNETDMAKWLVKNGPISIAINANAMQFYMGGISHPWKVLCNPSDLDHGVLIVGYGVRKYPLFNKTLPYWIVKNSWGTSWGEQGYYRVYRGDGTCGLNQTPSSAIVS